MKTEDPMPLEKWILRSDQPEYKYIYMYVYYKNTHLT